MTEANCTRCGASATGNSFEDASAKINHAIGLSRNIPCGDNYNCVVEVKKESYNKIESKSGEKIKLDESPPDAAPKPKTKSKAIKEKYL